MQKKNTAMVSALITFLGFTVISISSLFRGIDHHETWRIVLASVGGLLSMAFASLGAYHLIKNNKAAKA